MEKPWKVILAFVGIFIAGAVFGGFFALRIGQKMVQRADPRAGQRPGQSQPPMPPLAVQILRRFADRLELTDVQRDKVAPIVNRAEEELSRQRRESLEQTEAILRRVQQEFRAELTPDQRRRLDRMEQNQRELMRKERLNRAMQPQQFGPQGPGAGGQGRPFNQNQRPFKQGQRPNPNGSSTNQPPPNQDQPPVQNDPAGPPDAATGNPPARNGN